VNFPVTKIRFLPVMIFFASLMLTVKVGGIWSSFDNALNGTISVAPASAQQAPTQPAPAAQPAPQQAPKPATAPGQAGSANTAPVAAQDPNDPSASQAPAAAPKPSKDPTLLTRAEIDLLQQLAERREALEGREQDLEMRSGLLKAAETRIDKKVQELKVLQAKIQELIKSYDDQEKTKMQSLVKIYETMKPKDAARIFEELDMDTLLMVAERMKERKLAPIMASMNPGKAKEMTVELTKLRQLPFPGGETGG